MLHLDQISVAMDAGTLAADACLAPCQTVAVLGASGAGKSTLLDAIAGFRSLAAGRIFWNDQRLDTQSPQARPVSILFQEGNLFPHLTVGQNLGLALQPNGRRLSKDQRRRIDSALAEVGLAGYAPRMPGTLSGGQISRAALARVLLQDRPILLLDEPFSALGPATRRDMLALVRTVSDRIGALTIMVTHDPQDAKTAADAVMLVADGRVEPPQQTGALFADPPPALRAYLGLGD